MKIPKIIHYCWFGGKDLPDLERKCIATWKKYLPEYELKFWNEETFIIDEYKFCKQAYEKNYYAFVSDFVRSKALYQYGGIYLDTDMEVLEDFSSLLNGFEAVLGFENSTHVGTAMMAFSPHHEIMKEFYSYYKELSFLDENGRIKITANPSVLAEILKNHGVDLNGKEQQANGVKIYKRELFFPKKIADENFKVSKETYTIHHFKGSWLTERQKKRGQNWFWIEVCRPILKKCMEISTTYIGKQKTDVIENKIRNWLK